MDTEKIEVLIRAIELGSLSKAAKEFLYTPSAVSHILDAIEKEIGIKFIKRTHWGIEVEKGCEEIVANLQKIVDIKKKTCRLATDIKKQENVLTVATYASLSKHILTKIIKGFNKTNPDIHINILVCDSIKDAYDEGVADLFIGERVEDDCLWDELMVDKYVAVFPKRPKGYKESIEIEELSSYPFIQVKDKKISKYIENTKIENIIYVDSHDDSSVIHMVKEGLGVSVLPTLSVCDEDIDFLELKPGLKRVLGLIYKKDYMNHLPLKELINYIKKFDMRSSI